MSRDKREAIDRTAQKLVAATANNTFPNRLTFDAARARVQKAVVAGEQKQEHGNR